MFVKLTASGKRRYVQLVESYRDDAGRVKKRTVATLGRLDQIGGELDSVINGLLRVSGRPPVCGDTATPAITFESARALGDVWTLTELWNALGFSELRRVFRRTRHAIDVEALIRVMVFNRLCDPDSKLGVLRWLQTVAVPQLDSKAITHQQLLRAMDALVDHAGAVDAAVAALLRPMIDQDLSVVFYDLTTIRTEGLSVGAEGNLSHRAERILSRGGRPTRGWSAVDKYRSFAGRFDVVRPAEGRTGQAAKGVARSSLPRTRCPYSGAERAPRRFTSSATSQRCTGSSRDP